MTKKRKFIQIFVVAVLLGGVVLYFAFVKEQGYQKIEYQIEYQSDTLFLEEDLRQYVHSNCPKVIGKLSDSVNLTEFERIVDKYPYLESADVVNNFGVLVIKALQHKILCKVYTSDGSQYFLSATGKMVPAKKRSAGRVIIVNGTISDKYNPNIDLSKWDSLKTKSGSKIKEYPPLYTVWKILQYIENDHFWKAEIGQIYVNSKKEIELVPVVGNHTVIFGKLDPYIDPQIDIETKFANLKDIYTNGFKIKKWDKYKSVNLKFGMEHVPCQTREYNFNSYIEQKNETKKEKK
ncbi:MAG: hypothetical protein LBR36_04540 [Bacteroidales bacterium]|nr:hypothetical protein [Bacteroidales bacterium]